MTIQQEGKQTLTTNFYDKAIGGILGFGAAISSFNGAFTAGDMILQHFNTLSNKPVTGLQSLSAVIALSAVAAAACGTAAYLLGSKGWSAYRHGL